MKQIKKYQIDLMTQKRPNFLIVGAAKCATTSFAKYLGKHSNVFIPEIKEPRYFVSETILRGNKKDPLYSQITKNSVFDKLEYYNLFNTSKSLRGEASVHYLFHYQEAIPKIKKELGDIPIIIILRNPVDRAISNWMYLGLDFLSFKEALKNEKNRINDKYNSFWYYRQLGFYYEQVKAYMENFTKVKIILYDEIQENTEKVVNDTFSFLAVSIEKVDSEKKYNMKKTYDSKIKLFNKSKKAKRYLFKLSSFFNVKDLIFTTRSTDIDKKILSALNEEFLDDIKNLEGLIEKDLTSWKIKYS